MANEAKQQQGEKPQIKEGKRSDIHKRNWDTKIWGDSGWTYYEGLEISRDAPRSKDRRSYYGITPVDWPASLSLRGIMHVNDFPHCIGVSGGEMGGQKRLLQAIPNGTRCIMQTCNYSSTLCLLCLSILSSLILCSKPGSSYKREVSKDWHKLSSYVSLSQISAQIRPPPSPSLHVRIRFGCLSLPRKQKPFRAVDFYLNHYKDQISCSPIKHFFALQTL